MKKAKIFLSAMAIFAVVGGALAFQAHSKINTTYFTCVATGADLAQTTTATFQPGATLVPTASAAGITCPSELSLTFTEGE